MATGERYLLLSHHHQHYVLNSNNTSSSDNDFEEADIWNSTGVDEISSSQLEVSSGGKMKKKKKKSGKLSSMMGARSLPMKVPDWSKVVVVRKQSEEDEESESEEGDEVWFPPHVFLARQRRHDGAASFSVHEGIGRTLKGRDLSRVRDAIWKQTGFED